MKKIKVLYIDDEEINLESFYSTFRREYEVYTAKSADKGMELLDINNDISIIISDQKMPHKTGVAFFEEVKVKYPDTIRIILTAYADYETAFDSINRGYVFRFVQKPWNFEELSNVIEDSYKIYSLTKKNKALLSQYQLLFDHHTIPVFIVEKDSHKIVKANKCAVEFFSLEDVNVEINRLIPFNSVLDYPKQVISLTNNNNEIRKILIKFEEINWDSQPCYLVSLEDKTDFIDFEKKKIEFISSMQDKERKQLAMELHDGFAQDLVLLKLYYEGIVDSEEVGYHEFMDTYQKLTDGIRSLSYSLNPPDLQNGITEGLQKFFLRMNAVSDTNFICQIDNLDAVNHLLDDTRSFHLFRIVQEFVNNSLKHAQSSLIKLSIVASNGNFEMKIEDNGIGFSDDIVSSGLGLQNMKDRCRVASMEFELTSVPGQGTQVKVTFKE